MARRHRGVTLIMVVVLVGVIGMAGALAVQFGYTAHVERRQALVEANARQLLASGLAWARTHRDQLPASGQSRSLPIEQLIDPSAEAQLCVVRCEQAGTDCVTVEARVRLGRAVVNRSLQQTLSPVADAAPASPD